MDRNLGLFFLNSFFCVFFLKVECGYWVFLECVIVDVEIFYIIDGFYFVECNVKFLVSIR